MDQSFSRTMKRGIFKVSSFNQKIALTYVVVFACYGAYFELQKQLPAIPINFYSLIWLLSLVFPIVATVYSLTKLRVRLNEIMEVARPDELWDVYFHRNEDSELAFEQYARRRLSEYYGLFEYAGYSLLAGIVALTFFTLLASQLGIPNPTEAPKVWTIQGPIWAIFVGAAFLGSYTGSIVHLLRRYRTFDLRPTAFLQVTVMLVAGTLAGAFFTIFYSETWVSALAFVIAYMAAINVYYLSQLMKNQFANMTGTKLPDDIETDLKKIVGNTEAIDALKGISINSIKELANSDPIRIYFNVPQELNVIMNMIDEAVLHTHFGSLAEELTQAHVTTFTQLISRIGARFKKGESPWPDKLELLDHGGAKDRQILEGCKSIVTAGNYHSLLGLRLLEYRTRHFKNSKKK